MPESVIFYHKIAEPPLLVKRLLIECLGRLFGDYKKKIMECVNVSPLKSLFYYPIKALCWSGWGCLLDMAKTQPKQIGRNASTLLGFTRYLLEDAERTILAQQATHPPVG
ncbi:hypothetical protein PHYPSEUDO_009572 [Phytophthora pseudosyringae]|uniref:Uncharacterized protein n=1 Tax=Phytophthora pseudosyringae TaxID=221518 RepID=A0A8T1WLS0_9STRA|nr:hypothetical protein PHYPSEUDO_009572 [Phytophthora pseudosyringae]